MNPLAVLNLLWRLGSEKFGEASRAVPSRGSQLSTLSVEEANPVLVQQVFGLFKSYLNTQLEEKGKQIEKDVVELKFKGNQKQFKLKILSWTKFRALRIRRIFLISTSSSPYSQEAETC